MMGIKRGEDKDSVWYPYSSVEGEPSLPQIVRAEGIWLWDRDDKRYMDLIASWWVNLHGHGHPRLLAALEQQAHRLGHVALAGATHEGAVRLARRLVDGLGGSFERVFFSDNGSTAVEVALKLAWQYWRRRGEKRKRFLSFKGNYHGDTLAAMSVGFSCGFYEPFADMVLPVDFVPFADTWHGDNQDADKQAQALRALDEQLERDGDDIAAVIIEPLVQGAGGMRMSSVSFLQDVMARLREHDALIIFDEVLTGFYRTGKMFACDHVAVKPDMVCLAKGLTGGMLPLAATVVGSKVTQVFEGAGGVDGQGTDERFMHGHTYTANPLGCAVAHASLDLLQAPALPTRIESISRIHAKGLRALQHNPRVHRCRQCGVIAAFDYGLEKNYHEGISDGLRRRCIDAGLWLRPLGSTLYMLPPYCISDDELGEAWRRLQRVLEEHA